MEISVIDNSSEGGEPTEFVNGPADGEIKVVNRELKRFIIAITFTPIIPDGVSKPMVVEHLYEMDESGDVPVYRHKKIVNNE